MPLLGRFGAATLAGRATEDGVGEVESCILIAQVDVTKQGLKRIICARQKVCQLAFLYMGNPQKWVHPSNFGA